jgi:hypothetical protein
MSLKVVLIGVALSLTGSVIANVFEDVWSPLAVLGGAVLYAGVAVLIVDFAWSWLTSVYAIADRFYVAVGAPVVWLRSWLQRRRKK